MTTLVFDIETIPDIALIKNMYQLSSLSDHDALSAASYKWRQKYKGRQFPPHNFHQIVAISVVLSDHDNLKVWSLGKCDSSEKELINRFFKIIDTYTPQLVSWNGRGFDLPVLHYRALMHKEKAATYFETGAINANFKWNNYISRFHPRHCDVMDVMANYQLNSAMALTSIATQCGFPGKMGMGGHAVHEYYQNHQLKKIRDYCETDVLNTYLVYLNWLYVQGQLDESNLSALHNKLKNLLVSSPEEHLKKFYQQWQTP